MLILAFIGIYFLGVISGVALIGMMAATDVDDQDDEDGNK